MAKKNNNKKKNNGGGTAPVATPPVAKAQENILEKPSSVEEVKEESSPASLSGINSESVAADDEGADKKVTESELFNGLKDSNKDKDKIKELEEKIQQLTLQLSKTEEAESTNKVETETTDSSEQVKKLKAKLEETEGAKEKVEQQYEALLSRLGSMKAVFSKMKEAQSELEQTQEQLSEYEKHNLNLKQKLDSVNKEKHDLEKNLKLLKEESSDLNSECDRLSQDLSSLRHEFEQKESDWSAEKADLSTANHKQSHEIETLKQNNEEYLITLENDKIINTSLNNEITELNEKVNELSTVIQDLKTQITKKDEKIETLSQGLDEFKQKSQTESDHQLSAYKQLEDTLAQTKVHMVSLEEENSNLKEESTKISKFEQEIKEKQLQIGKLRHEAVILNEHLTKALQLIKRNSSSETVDRELITNLLISFLQIPRGDTKKFEVLQLISNFLNWDEDKKIQAGLIQSGSASAKRSSRESFVSLWTEYLEKESSKST